MIQIFYKVPFASSGDLSAIAIPVDLTGVVSMTQGWGPDYALDPAVSGSALDIDRATTNWLFYSITQNLQQYQTFGTPELITTANNGGTAYAYAKNARVRYQVTTSDPWHVYTSKVDANTDLPTVTASWTRDDEWLTAIQISGTYETQTHASTTYETQTHAASTYETQTHASTTYAPKANATFSGTTTFPNGTTVDTSGDVIATVGNIGAHTMFVDQVLPYTSSGAINNGTLQLNAAQGITCHGSTFPSNDNGFSLGSAFLRWSVVYAGTGTINTSDARLKTDVRPFSDAEISAAIALKNEIGFFQFKAAISEKGTGYARQHCGMTVQRAIKIMQSFELDPMAYGFICYDKWSDKIVMPKKLEQIIPAIIDEEGVELEPQIVIPGSPAIVVKAGDSYGFRVDELTLFILKGIGADFENRLAVLEAK